MWLWGQMTMRKKWLRKTVISLSLVWGINKGDWKVKTKTKKKRTKNKWLQQQRNRWINETEEIDRKQQMAAGGKVIPGCSKKDLNRGEGSRSRRGRKMDGVRRVDTGSVLKCRLIFNLTPLCRRSYSSFNKSPQLDFCTQSGRVSRSEIDEVSESQQHTRGEGVTQWKDFTFQKSHWWSGDVTRPRRFDRVWQRSADVLSPDHPHPGGGRCHCVGCRQENDFIWLNPEDDTCHVLH